VFQQLSIRPFGLLLIAALTAITTNSVASQDGLFINSGQLDADQLIKAVLARNPSVEAMWAAWQAAEQRIEQASSLDDPMLTYSFAPETRNTAGQDFGQKIQLSQKLPWPGKLALREDSARFEAKATEENVALVQLHLFEATSNVFADWYYIHEALRINGINQELWEEFRVIAELKYSTGRASKQDALRTEVEQAMLEHQSIVLKRKQRNILTRINTLLNRVPDADIPPPAALPDARELPDVRSLREQALIVHPTLKALNAQLLAHQAQQALAERDYYPDFNVSAGYNSLWNQNEKRFTVGVGINLPLDQSKRNARADETRASAKQVQWQITDKQAEVAGAVQRAYNSVEESRHILILYQNKLLPLAKENLQAGKYGYQSGKGDFLDLVSAEKNFILTQLNHLQALADHYRHLAMLTSRVGDPRSLHNAFTTSSVLQGESQ